MIGQFLINLLFASSLVAAGSYAVSISWGETLRTVGRWLFFFVAGGMVVASAMVMYSILTHDFTYSYIWGHSSRELSTPLLIATFYAGQEGSFMLWTLFVALIGVVLVPYLRRHNYESEVMMVFSLITAVLLLMLVAKSPFALLWETFAADGIAEGFEPQNGKGLNPLLHNLWITIHPPLLFTGFASMSVPFAFAVAALIKKDWQQWVSVSLPWTLFATAVLGVGIMLGGFWAYETLGWGGFWAWDPVENSSLIPWIVAVALVHTMLTQKKTKGLVKTNLFLAISAFILVLYSTFLTRSGVLGDTSVHSFVDPGFFAYVLLIAIMAIFSILGYGLILFRAKDIAAQRAEFHPTSREFQLSIGSSLLMASAVIILIGTSWPIITELLGRQKVAIDIAYYNKIHIWVAVAIGLLNALSILASWKATPTAQLAKRLGVPAVLSLVFTAAISMGFAVRDYRWLAMIFGALFMVIVNFDMMWRMLRKTPSLTGAYVSHFGLGLMILGVVAIGGYTEISHARLVLNEPVKVLGYTLTFVGKEQIEKQYADREKYRYFVDVEKDGSKVRVAPILYWSDFNKRQSAFLEPGVSTRAAYDLYVSPKALEVEGAAPSLTLRKGEQVPLPIDSSWTIEVSRFDMSGAQNAEDPSKIKVGVRVILRHDGQEQEYGIYSLMTGMGEGGAQMSKLPLNIPGTTYFAALSSIIPDRDNLGNSQVVLDFADTKRPETMPREVFAVEFSTKPFINFVWFGTIFMVSGFFISIARRTKELGLPSKEAASRTVAPRQHSEQADEASA